ncbi:TetR/AcrR family transcriptional regulator [Hoeflea sp. TYP-13]|uniref:TetR/AcrR family transcriptional regulator n=1 Tax=Hoeflea sp. TYP-13 TaxID=3230023 RepID=UPI0034C6A58C
MLFTVPMALAEKQRPKTSEARRRRILEAARTVFQAKGGLGAGMRPIAAEAGCTTGAIYAAFSSKEDIYAALLEESLRELALMVAGAAGREAAPDKALHAAIMAFFEYYQSHIFEYSLGLYLFEKDGRKGLGTERDAALNALLAQSLNVLTVCFERLGARSGNGPRSSAALANALFATLIGVMAMVVSGRDRSLQVNARDMLETTVDIYLASLGNNTVTE